MKYMNSSFEKLYKNLSDNYFKYLTKAFGSKKLELLKLKGTYPYEYMDSFKSLREEKLPDKKYFYSPVKDKTTSDDDENVNSHINY